MAVGKIYVFAVLTALVAVNLIFAEESSLEQGSELFNDIDVSAEAERKARSPHREEGEGRLFFNIFPVPVAACNSTQQATCASCTQAVRCTGNGTGILRNCRGYLRYCNNGRCSFIPGSNCSSG